MFDPAMFGFEKSRKYSIFNYVLFIFRFIAAANLDTKDTIVESLTPIIRVLFSCILGQ